MTLALAALVSATLMSTTSPPAGLEADSGDLYAQRIALAAADEACALFSPAERALLDALAARSRDDAALEGAAPAALDRFEARHQTPPPDCGDDIPGAGEHRAHARALAATHEITFPGHHQDWVSERRLRSTPLWRLRQAAQGEPAILGVHAGETSDTLALALRSAAAPAYAVLIVRDPARQAAPLDFTAGGLLPPPFDDPLSAWGGAAGAERRVTASGRLDADMAARLAPASGDPAYAFTFPDRAIEAIRALAPREGLRIDLFGARGEILETLWFEAGMFNAALAVQALPLPQPQPAAAPAAIR